MGPLQANFAKFGQHILVVVTLSSGISEGSKSVKKPEVKHGFKGGEIPVGEGWVCGSVQRGQQKIRRSHLAQNPL